MNQHLVITVLFLSLVLPGHAFKVKSWGAYFWQGQFCNSEATGQGVGPSSPNKGRECHAIPALGASNSMDLYTNEDRGYLITMGLHRNSDCSDDGGIYESSKNSPTCIQLEAGQVAYSIRTQRMGKRGLDEPATIDSTELQASDENELTERDTCFTASFSLTAGIAATGFWYNAVGTCPATADDKNIDNARCAAASVLGVFFTLLSAFTGYGTYQNGKRSVLTVGSSFTSHTDGMSTTFTRLEDALAHPYPTEDGWSHYRVDAVDHEDGFHNYTNVISFHKDGAGRITHPLEADDDSRLQERRNKYVAYYGWTDGDTSRFKKLPVCTTKKSAKTGAEQLYNYGHSHNSGDFCANLRAGGYTLTHGNFAVLDGTFTDYAGRC